MGHEASDDAMNLLCRLARGEGGRRTGELLRAGYLTWRVTSAGWRALRAWAADRDTGVISWALLEVDGTLEWHADTPGGFACGVPPEGGRVAVTAADRRYRDTISARGRVTVCGVCDAFSTRGPVDPNRLEGVGET